MLALLADLGRGDGQDAVWVIFAVLAVAAVICALYFAHVRNFLGAGIAAAVALVLLVLAL